jgi:hypothetical protein
MCNKYKKILILIILFNVYIFIIIFLNNYNNLINILFMNFTLGIGDWGLGIGDWGLGFGPKTP